MKCIDKQAQEPESFTNWKSLSNEDWQPSYDELSGAEKRDVVRALLEEQGFICCYCGQGIADKTCHIEHFRPQSGYPGLELEYSNFHASCQKKREKKMPQYCGVAKDDWFDERYTLSPLEPECEEAFLFTDDGQVSLKDPENTAAQQTLKHLKLDESALNDLRGEAIAGFIDDDFLANAPQELLARLSRKVMEREADGTFVPFCFAIQQRLQRFLPKVR